MTKRYDDMMFKIYDGQQHAWSAAGENQGVEAFLSVEELSSHQGDFFLDIMPNIVT